jgi:MoaA/NifB/PqqE/SkfB family radical SAM enzyme
MDGASVDGYRAPLFVAWQLSNRCTARCLACCEESGPDAAWVGELTRGEALALVRCIIDADIPYVAFGGGEPLGVAYCWELFELLSDAGVALKIETDGQRIDGHAADRLAALGVQCVQISVDGATPATHELVRPGSRFAAATAAITLLTERGLSPELVFVPNRFNIHEMIATYELAETLGCSSFVSGPMMRIGRAAADWDRLACGDEVWEASVDALERHAASAGSGTKLAIYPWDILTEIERRLESPQAMLLVVPNGRVKLLNALPFSPADLRRDSLEQAWQAYRDAWRSAPVRAFASACRRDPGLLRHANETWSPAEGRERVAALMEARPRD